MASVFASSPTAADFFHEIVQGRLALPNLHGEASSGWQFSVVIYRALWRDRSYSRDSVSSAFEQGKCAETAAIAAVWP
ncbi:hypothetical protein ATY79_00750 [Rhizobium sp. R693]|nr:hypothetical protein ATY79_00750 [Rhizobium sp. R693]